MGNRSKRPGTNSPNIPPRPQLIPQQVRDAMAAGQRVLNREQSITFASGLAANLANLLNSREQLPWLTSTIEKRSDGFSLHVQVLNGSDDDDAVIGDQGQG